MAEEPADPHRYLASAGIEDPNGGLEANDAPCSLGASFLARLVSNPRFFVDI